MIGSADPQQQRIWNRRRSRVSGCEDLTSRMDEFVNEDSNQESATATVTATATL